MFNVCAHVGAGTHRGLKKALDTLKLQLQVVVSHPVWVLLAKICSGRAASVLTCRVITLPLLASEQQSTSTGHVCLDFSSPPESLLLQISGETGAPLSHKKHTAPSQPKLHLRTMQVVFLHNIPNLGELN